MSLACGYTKATYSYSLNVYLLQVINIMLSVLRFKHLKHIKEIPAILTLLL